MFSFELKNLILNLTKQYAHIADRDWEAFDGRIFGQVQFDEGCRDAASQLVDDHPYINVIFGGGRRYFIPNSTFDAIDSTVRGLRTDGRNLINDWKNFMESKNLSHQYVNNADGIRSIDATKIDYAFGMTYSIF